MATRARVGIKQSSGQIYSIYVHHDGDINHLGKILMLSYDSQEKTKNLINMGDASFIEKEIGEINSFYNTNYEYCLFYHRDRNELLNIQIDNTLDDFLKHYVDYYYIYLNKWYVIINNQYLPLDLII